MSGTNAMSLSNADQFAQQIADLGGYAEIYGAIDVELLAEPIAHGFSHRGQTTRPGAWSNKESTVGGLALALSHHAVGPKDGPAIVPSSLIGGQRKKSAAKFADLVGLDVDCGFDFDVLIKQVQAAGLFCVLHTTHSHLRGYTDVAQKHFHKWSDDQSRPHDLDALKTYLADVKKMMPKFADSATAFSLEHLEDGVFYRVQHDPIPKARLFFLLLRRIVFANHADSLEAAQAEYRQLILGLGAELGVPVDEACTDPSRLFFMARHDADATEFRSAIVFGEMLDADAILSRSTDVPDVGPPTAPTNDHAKGSAVPSVAGDLKRWVARNGRRFQVVQALLHHAPEQVGSDAAGGDGRHIVCPFEEEHSTPGGEGTFAVDAIGGDGFRISCSHNSCKAANRDRLTFVGKLVEDGTLPRSALDEPAFLVGEDQNLDTLEAAFPLPKEHGNFAYRMFGGRPWVHERDKEDAAWRRLFTPLTIQSGVKYADRDGVRALRVSILDEDGTTETLDIATGLAMKGYGAELRARLREAGVTMTAEGGDRIVQLFREIQPPNATVVLDPPGWRDGAFITPWGGVIGSNRPIELAAGIRPSGEAAAGTLEGWKAAAAAAFESQALHFQVGTIAGFVSPIIDLCAMPTVWLAYVASSSTGKTTAQRLQAAVWGDAHVKRGLLGSFNGTVKASEALLERASGAGYGFDEHKLIDGRDLQHLMFQASGGGGTDRLTRESTLRKTRQWSALVTLSGEVSLFQKIKGSGDTVTTGLGARCLELNVEDAPGLTDIIMTKIEAAYQNHGHAGPEFVRHLIAAGYINEPERLECEVAERARILAKDSPAVALRAARIAALVWRAGELAQDAGLIPSEFDMADMAAKLWSKAMESDTAPTVAHDVAIRTLFESLITRRGVDVAESAYGGTREAVAWRLSNLTDVITTPVYVVPVAKLAALAGGALDHKALARALDDRGALHANPRSDRATRIWDYVPGIGKVRAVVIDASAIGDEEG